MLLLWATNFQLHISYYSHAQGTNTRNENSLNAPSVASNCIDWKMFTVAVPKQKTRLKLKKAG